MGFGGENGEGQWERGDGAVFAGVKEEGAYPLCFYNGKEKKFPQVTPHFMEFTEMAQAHLPSLTPTRATLSLTGLSSWPNPKLPKHKYN